MKRLLFIPGMIAVLVPIAMALDFGALEGIFQGIGMFLMFIAVDHD